MAQTTFNFLAVVNKTANYTLTSQDGQVNFDASSGNLTATLPLASAVPVGKVFQIKKVDSSGNTVSLIFAGGNLADGRSSIVLRRKDDFANLVSTGSGWVIQAKKETEIITSTGSATLNTVVGPNAYASAGSLLVTLTPGQWRLQGNFYSKIQTSDNGFTINSVAGFYGAPGTNTTTPPAALSTIASIDGGAPTYGSQRGDGVIGTLSGTIVPNIYFSSAPIEVIITVTTTVSIYLIPNVAWGAQPGANTNIASYAQAQRLW